MPLDHTRFTRTPPADPQPANKAVVDVVSARASTGTHRASSGITSRRTSRVLEMHEKEGMGQLTSDLTVHSLLEEVLETTGWLLKQLPLIHCLKHRGMGRPM